MKKILITGATGFMGSRAAKYYEKKYDVYAPGHHNMDITDTDSVRRYFDKIRPDYVLHCAAISDVGTCEKNPEAAGLVNVEASVRIAQAAAEAGSKCLLCSSDQVYVGSTVREPHKETEQLSPGNVYGRGKLEAEYRGLEVNPDSVFLRLSWMYDTITLTEKHSDFIRTFWPKYRNGETLIYSDMDYRGVTDINEVVENLEIMFRAPGGVYNFGAPNPYSFYDAVEQAFEELGFSKEQLKKMEGATFRNLTMNQEKVLGAGVRFRSTVEGFVENLKKGF